GLDGYLRRALADDHPTRDLIVQYRESDLALIGRLTEHDGISFYFEQADGNDRMVLCDGSSAWPRIAGVGMRSRQDDVGVFAVATTSAAVSRIFAVNDYNYRTPQADLGASEPLETGLLGGVVEYGSHQRTRD